MTAFTISASPVSFGDVLLRLARSHDCRPSPNTEVFTDERFSVPPVKLAITSVAPPQPIARAVDDTGNDVTATLHDLDGNYLDNFGRGQYQGVTRDHYVEIDLGEDAPIEGPLCSLRAAGYILLTHLLTWP